MSLGELNESLFRLTWHKAPGSNGVSPNAIKSLSHKYRIKLLNLITIWLKDNDFVYESWQSAALKVLPKKGNLLDPNNWRGIVLMDVVSKTVSIFINIRLQRLMKIRGTPLQFGATPNSGCQDGVFVLKTLLQERREKALDTWVIFVDLVKAYDSIQHKLIDETLAIFGVPSDIRSWVRKLYNGSTVKLKVGKIESLIAYGCGVKQGDSLAPLLFIMVVQLAAETLDIEFKKHNIKILDVYVTTERIDAMLRKHNITNIENYSLTAILILLYIDDGAIPFASRRDAILGLRLCIEVFKKFGLIVHVGSKEKSSKTKAVFFPGTNTIRRWRINSQSLLDISSNQPDNDLPVSPLIHSPINLEDIYKRAPETADIILNDDEKIPFATEFCYLGSAIDFLIDDTVDIKCRISKANKAMGALGFIWRSKQVRMETKIKLFLAIPVNLALWNCETWSGNKVDLKSLDIFFHKSIRRILNLRMSIVKKNHITNTQICIRFGNVNSLAHIMKYIMLKFLGRTLRQDPSVLSRVMLTSFIPGELLRGRPFRTNRNAIAEAIRVLIPSTPESAPLKYWAGYASDRILWEKMIKYLHQRTYPPFFVRNGYNTRSRSSQIPQSPPSPSHSSSSDSESKSPSPPSTPPRTFHNNHQTSPIFNFNSTKMTRVEARNILNVGINASRREISLKFKILSRKYHPDKWSPESSDSYSTRTKKFQIIANARELLVR